EVEDELEFSGLLDRYLGGQGSAEDSIGERPSTSREGDVIDGVRDERAVVVRPERNETAVACELRRFTHGGQPILHGQVQQSFCSSSSSRSRVISAMSSPFVMLSSERRRLSFTPTPSFPSLPSPASTSCPSRGTSRSQRGNARLIPVACACARRASQGQRGSGRRVDAWRDRRRSRAPRGSGRPLAPGDRGGRRRRRGGGGPALRRGVDRARGQRS